MGFGHDMDKINIKDCRYWCKIINVSYSMGLGLQEIEQAT